MRIQGLINRLKRLKEKYGNVEVVTYHQGQFTPPKASWLIDGALWDLDEFAELSKEEENQIVL